MKNFAEILNKSFPDGMNPVLVKELRQTLNGRTLAGSFIGLVLISILFCFLDLQISPVGRGTGFSALYVFIYWFMLILPAAGCFSRWYVERGQDCLTPEYTTTLSPFTILNGKLLSVLISSLILFLAGLPAFLFLCGRWDYSVPLFSGLFLLAFAFFLATVMFLCLLCLSQGRRKVSTGSLPGITLLGLLFWFVGFQFLEFFCYPAREGAFDMAIQADVLLFSFAVQCYFWCYARLLPEQANRMVLPRISGLILCLLLVALSGVCRLDSGLVLCYYGTVNVLIASFERLEQTKRSCAELPENPFLRQIVFFFSSGACRGLFYGIVFLAAGILLLFFTDASTGKWGDMSWNGRFAACLDWYNPYVAFCLYLVFYAELLLVLRRWNPRWKPLVLLLIICGFLSLPSMFCLFAGGGEGIFFLFSPLSIAFGEKSLAIPALLCAAILVVIVIQNFSVAFFRKVFAPRKGE